MTKYFGANLKQDFPASIVVFLVALPLCLGIAVASGAEPITGLIAGIVGGIVVGALSGSNVSVSGPAAGLTVIVLNAIEDLGSFELLLAATFVAGIMQVILGLVRAGVIGYYFPNSVIKGMLAAIGLILILKQIPHAMGQDVVPDGDMNFQQADQHNTFTEILIAFQNMHFGAVIITVVGMFLLIMYDKPFLKNHKVFGIVPGALVAVLSGVGLNQLFANVYPDWHLTGNHLVNLPVVSSISDLTKVSGSPDFSMLGSSTFWVVSITIALIASIETLLSIEAADKIDPYKRITPANRELWAQGAGNMVSGLLGGLPVTAVIVRSSANVTAGGRTKMSAIMHAMMLLVLALAIPDFLNLIPLSILAAVLFMVGYKLTKPSLWKKMFENGWSQFVPFAVTVIAILFSDLLMGIGIGLVVGVFFVIRSNFKKAISLTERNGNYLLKLQKDVYFMNKANLIENLNSIPANSTVLISATTAKFIDHDILELLDDFRTSALEKDIKVYTEGLDIHLEKL
jgi:MFS superfamily sulfate permease-like transporter